MTQGKHTPGFLHRPTHSRRSREPSDFNVASFSGRSVCSTGGYSDNNPETYDENKANARRICAVWNACEGIPTEALEAGVVKDMLEALVEIRHMLWSRPDISDRLRPLMGFSEKATAEKAQAAITKATGEKP